MEQEEDCEDWLGWTTRKKHSGTGQREMQTIRHMRVMGNRWKQSGIRGNDQTGYTRGRASDLKREESYQNAELYIIYSH